MENASELARAHGPAVCGNLPEGKQPHTGKQV
jgi:hypothetical protein